MWLADPLPEDVARSLEQLARAEDVQRVVVMPDVHLAGDVCVGAVVATRRLLYPTAVGSDIGCGMAAIQFNAPASQLANETAAAHVLAGLYGHVPAIKHPPASAADQRPPELQDAPLSDHRLERLKARDARLQFGTLGRGNHFLEFQADSDDQLWLMVHSGSRGIGQAIAKHHLTIAHRGGRGMELAWLDAESPAGEAYLADASWAARYAEQNRLAIIRAVVELLVDRFGVTAVSESLIHADHNHVRRESHGDQVYWVHRKGAQSALDGEWGVIPGSMGTASFHVTGRGCIAALCSSSHGAGRAMSRAEAARTIGSQRLLREMKNIWFDKRRCDRLRDEAPSAYKNIYAVMRAQRELTRIERELKPLLSYKGS